MSLSEVLTGSRKTCSDLVNTRKTNIRACSLFSAALGLSKLKNIQRIVNYKNYFNIYLFCQL